MTIFSDIEITSIDSGKVGMGYPTSMTLTSCFTPSPHFGVENMNNFEKLDFPLSNNKGITWSKSRGICFASKGASSRRPAPFDCDSCASF